MAINLNGTTGITTTGLTSNGIDDNATSTAMTLDTSGNVLVGKTVADTTTLGNTVYAGIVSATMSGDPAIFANRAQDGSVIEIQKNGTTVGSIGIESGGLTIDGESGHSGLRFGGSDIAPRDNGVDVDAGIQLGNNIYRFTDLYLSGGVYLGGTGSSNKLDDYEEGTFAPTFTPDTSGSLPLQNNYDTMQYVKIGNWVTLSGFIRASTPSSPVGSSPNLGNFPFTVANLSDAAGRSSGSVSYFDDSAGNWSVLPVYIVESQTQAYVKIDSSTIGNNDGFYISLNYRTT